MRQSANALRIEQPEHLRPLYIETLRRGSRLGVRGILILGLFPSAILLSSLAQQTFGGQPVAPLRWLGAIGMGPLCIALVKVQFRFQARGHRFAEIHHNRIRLGPGGSFRLAYLTDCKIESDDNFPKVHLLCFYYRRFRLARLSYWAIMVEDLVEAEKFRREILERAAEFGR